MAERTPGPSPSPAPTVEPVIEAATEPIRVKSAVDRYVEAAQVIAAQRPEFTLGERPLAIVSGTGALVFHGGAIPKEHIPAFLDWLKSVYGLA